MGVRVDEARKNDGVAVIDDRDLRARSGGRQIALTAGGYQALAAEYPPATQRGARDRKDPRGAVENQCPVRRAFFSAALLAA